MVDGLSKKQQILNRKIVFGFLASKSIINVETFYAFPGTQKQSNCWYFIYTFFVMKE